jgi:hypothetical protein
VLVVAVAAATMLLAPLALLHGGAATAAATDMAKGTAGAAPSAASPLGATQFVSSNLPSAPLTPAQRARHAAAVHRNRLRWHHAQAMHRSALRHAAQVRSYQRWLHAHHAAAVAHNHALWLAGRARHHSAARIAPVKHYRANHFKVGAATWYAWHPGQCASPFLPHGTMLTVTDLATHKTIHCLVTDTEAHNPGRVVDLSQDCFEQLGALSQGVILVRISW